MSTGKQTFPFTIHSPEELVTVTVFDALDNKVYDGVGDAVIELPEAIYLVRSSRCGVFEDRTVKHTALQPGEITIASPPFYSVFPLPGAEGLDKKFRNAFVELSELDSANKEEIPDLVLAIRFTESLSSKKDAEDRITKLGIIKSTSGFQSTYSLINCPDIIKKVTVFEKEYAVVAIRFNPESVAQLYNPIEIFADHAITACLLPNHQTRICFRIDKGIETETVRISVITKALSQEQTDRSELVLDYVLNYLENKSQALPASLFDKWLQHSSGNFILDLALMQLVKASQREIPERLKYLFSEFGDQLVGINLLGADLDARTSDSLMLNAPLFTELTQHAIQLNSIRSGQTMPGEILDEIQLIVNEKGLFTSWPITKYPLHEKYELDSVPIRDMDTYEQKSRLSDPNFFTTKSELYRQPVPDWFLTSLWEVYNSQKGKENQQIEDVARQLGVTPDNFNRIINQLFADKDLLPREVAKARLYGTPIRLYDLHQWLTNELGISLPDYAIYQNTEGEWTPYHLNYFAGWLLRRLPSNSVEKFASTLAEARITVQPYQIDAALFAFKSPLKQGALLADEVGLGKTIEAGIVIAQHWAMQKRRILIITPANLRKQWNLELLDKFRLPSLILEKKNFTQIFARTQTNPFIQNSIVIVSYEFAAREHFAMSMGNWDLVVIDEAHRLRNVYRSDRTLANRIKIALNSRKKILLTATPLQNNLLELYGLISIIDESIFGSFESFKQNYNRGNATDLTELKLRLEPVCKRTLRAQVREFVRFTRRYAKRVPFNHSPAEAELYQKVSEYLQRPVLYALPSAQRALMTLVLRRLLASSTTAISHTLQKFADRLSLRLRRSMQSMSVAPVEAYQSYTALTNEEIENLEEVISQDYDDLPDIIDEYKTKKVELNPDPEFDEKKKIEIETPVDESEYDDPLGLFLAGEFEAVQAEIDELKSYITLAESITQNAKGAILAETVQHGLKIVVDKGAARKALIFTESRRTQNYLYEILQSTPEFKGKIVLFNGDNKDIRSKEIFTAWKRENLDTDRITNSDSADMRTALVDYFRDHAIVMIATEAAAEGINLQFCSLVINYDLPWNPQRIEQRIGRCHRYGQKNDVVVMNFFNQQNAADKRTYELLESKFKLFGDVFGASDEVIGDSDSFDTPVQVDQMLGSVMSGIDFEKRVLDIFNQCRTTEEIERDFDKLEAEIDERKKELFEDTRIKVIENFDVNVARTLGIRFNEALSKYQTHLWYVARMTLPEFADFDEPNYAFRLHTNPFSEENIPLGWYQVPRNQQSSPNEELLFEAHPSRHYHLFTPAHPLAKRLINGAALLMPDTGHVAFSYSPELTGNHSDVEELIGKSGYMILSKLTLHAFESEDHLLFCAVDDEGNEIPEETCMRFFEHPGKVLDHLEVKKQDLSAAIDPKLNKLVAEVRSENERRNNEYYEAEKSKIEFMMQDVINGLGFEIDKLRRNISSLRKESSQKTALSEKLTIDTEIARLEKLVRTKRNERDDEEDRIDQKKYSLIDEVKSRLIQHTSRTTVFTIRWEVQRVDAHVNEPVPELVMG